MINRTLALGMALLFLAVSGMAGAAADREDGLTVFNTDVYVPGEFGVLGNPGRDTPSEAPLFNVAGTRLGVSWGEFAAASASAVTIDSPANSRTDVVVRLRGLIPGGVYSLFYVTFGPESRNPICPNAERGIPLTAIRPEIQRPDASSFVADRDGNANYHARVEGNLLEVEVLRYVLIFHFDGLTYHPAANYGEFATQGDECRTSYGADAMRQLIVRQKEPAF